MKHLICLLVALSMIAFPASAIAAPPTPCNEGPANNLTTLPPTPVSENMTQTVNYSVTRTCEPVTRVSVQWVVFNSIGQSFNITDEVDHGANYYGTSSWTVAVGTPDGTYGVLTRIYGASSASALATTTSTFIVRTPDMCPNMNGKQLNAPEGYYIGPDGGCYPQQPVAADPTRCLYGAADCPIIAEPTGDDPVPVSAHLVMTTALSHVRARPGTRVVYRVAVSNTGRATARNVRACVNLGPGLAHTGHSGLAVHSSKRLCWVQPILRAGKVARYSLVLRVVGQPRITTLKGCLAASGHTSSCITSRLRILAPLPR